jgi:heterodisulfide reductase subunit C
MQIISDVGEEVCDPTFARRIREVSGENLERCYQCLTCSSGCPVAYTMDYRPNQMMRMVQLGLKDRALKSSTIWICLSCHACEARCPNEIDIVKVMDALRQTSWEEGVDSQKSIHIFHNTFLGRIKSLGRVHELLLIMIHMIKSGDIFKFNKKLLGDVMLGMKMFLRRKLSILPHQIKGVKKVKEIFKATERA